MSEPIVRQRRTPPAGLGPVLRAARDHAGLSQSQLARRVGLTPGYLAKLENGTRCPSVTVAGRLAVVLALGDDERGQLLAAAVDDAGADHPYRRAA
jgi:transcriptional regulator with XRE-family HTH domain